jgi:hypothetical protein
MNTRRMKACLTSAALLFAAMNAGCCSRPLRRQDSCPCDVVSPVANSGTLPSIEQMVQSYSAVGPRTVGSQSTTKRIEDIEGDIVQLQKDVREIKQRLPAPAQGKPS